MAKDQRNFQRCLHDIREASVGIAFNTFAYYNNSTEGDGKAELEKIEVASKVIAKALRDIRKIED